MPDFDAPLTRVERASLALRGLYERCGYRKYRMSQFEEYGLYMENKNFLSADSVITFTDLDGRLMALKPDVTLSIVRRAANRPVSAEKLYYIENVYRPAAGHHTFEEISQIGCEYIGLLDDYAVCEVAALAARTLTEISPESLLEVGHMGFTAAMLNALGLSGRPLRTAMLALEQKNVPLLGQAARDAGLSEADTEALSALPGLYGPFEPTLARARALCRTDGMRAALDELEQVCAAVSAVGCGSCLTLDFSLVNDTDYYNGILLRGFLQGLPRPVLSGGRYDNILRKFGKKGGGIGFAVDLSELSRLSGRRNNGLDLLIRYEQGACPAAVAKRVCDAERAGLRVRALPVGEPFECDRIEKTVLIAADGTEKEGGTAEC